MKNILKKIKHINFKIVLLRLVCLAAILGLAFIPIYAIFKTVDANLWDALCSGNQHKIVEAVSKYDNYQGALIIAILQIVQDWSIVIPSAPIHIAAGVVLGTWRGFFVCHVADVASNMFVFWLYTKIKRTMDKFMPISETSRTVQAIKNGKSPIYMVVLTCLLPAVPNGFIPYAAVNAHMSLAAYTLAVTIGAAPPKIVLTAIGEHIFEGNWPLLVVLIVLALVGSLLLIRYQKQTVDLFLRCKAGLMKRQDKKKAKKQDTNTTPSCNDHKPPQE